MVMHFPHLNEMAKNLENAYNDQVVALSNLKSWPEFIMAIFIMAFFPALFEEVFFRGRCKIFLYTGGRRRLRHHRHFAVIQPYSRFGLSFLQPGGIGSGAWANVFTKRRISG